MNKNYLFKIFYSTLVPIFILFYTLSYHLTTDVVIQPERTLLMVRPVSYLIVILSIYVIFHELKNIIKKNNRLKNINEKIKYNIFNEKFKLGLLSLLYLITINTLGFVIITAAYLGITFRLLGIRSKKVIFLFPITLSVILFIIFQVLLRVSLPMGVFEPFRYYFYF